MAYHGKHSKRSRLRARPLAVFCGVMAATASAQAAGSCSVGGIEGLGVNAVTVVSATMVAATSAAPAYCDVTGQLNTSGDGVPAGSAGFELRLPDNWNNKFLFFGVGGLGGAGVPDFSANPPDQQAAVAKGYATVITDQGHLAGNTDASWALLAPGRPDKAKLADYDYRATHEVTLAGKHLTELYFAQGAIQEAYFDGCSNGGRQGLVEATRFPDDYDGIIAGDPFFDIRSIIDAARLAKQQLTPATYLPATLLPAVDAAVSASCGVADGVDDGLIQNPAACHFDPYSLVCTAGQTGNCLSTGQADTLTAYFTAVRTVTGDLVYPGFSVSNLATSATGPLTGGGADVWTTGLVPPTSFTAPEPWGNGGFSPAGYGYQFGDHIIQDFVTRDPTYDLRSYPVSADGFIGFSALKTFDARTKAADASNPADYASFIGSGRKLILYHGFSDPALSPFRTINLYRQLGRQAGGLGKLQQSARLFMVPGMQHCIGGPGPNVFDTLAPLEAWVENGVAPASIPAAHYLNDDPAQAVDRTMPLCPFPTQASYSGSGDVTSAANWSCTPNQKLLDVGTNGVQAGADGR